jgi:phasin family protein
LAAGFQDLTNFKALSVAKSVREAIDLQSTLSQAVTVKATAEAKKLIDASIKLTEQALAPLTSRMAAAVEGFAKAA